MKKNKIGAITLGLTLGIFGIHRFYLGKIGTGIIQLLLTLTYVGLIISVIWVIVDVNRIAFDNLK